MFTNSTTSRNDPAHAAPVALRSESAAVEGVADLKKILLCHNVYQQAGGEDQSFEQEARLLESRGHEVVRFSVHNDVIDSMSHLQVARRAVWNSEAYAELRTLIRDQRPDVMHCTNTFPLISPAAYYAARKEGVPVVQSLRNYRLLCPAAFLLRDQRVCEDCLGKSIPWPAVLHGCYRGSRLGSAAVSTMLSVHRMIKTWTKAIDRYFALTEFSRQKFIEGGLPAERIAVKPNFIDPDPRRGSGSGGYALFVGRLSTEKGVDTLLEAWTRLNRAVPLEIIGDGPLAEQVREAAARQANITWHGKLASQETVERIGAAACLVMPSIWYECFPRTILEALAKGTPVVASRIGSMIELVTEGVTGAHFEAGNASELAATVERLFANPESLTAMRPAARQEFVENYTAESNYETLIDIYRQARDLSRADRSVRAPRDVEAPTKQRSGSAQPVSARHANLRESSREKAVATRSSSS